MKSANFYITLHTTVQQWIAIFVNLNTSQVTWTTRSLPSRSWCWTCFMGFCRRLKTFCSLFIATQKQDFNGDSDGEGVKQPKLVRKFLRADVTGASISSSNGE